MAQRIRDYMKRNGRDYSSSPYADPRKPYRKPYNEMSALERRIDKRLSLASWLSLIAGAGVGVLIVLIIRALAS